MSVYEIAPARPVPLGAIGIFTVVSAVEGFVRSLRDWHARRTTVTQLRRLSDDQLGDIGLCRADIRDLARGA